MLIDTGSTVSIMNYATWKRLKKSGMDMRKSPVKLTGVDGGTFKSYGRRDIPVEIGDLQMVQDMEIGDCQDDVMLGMDFLKQHTSSIDFERPSLTIGEREVELTFYQPEVEKTHVIAARDVIVPDSTDKIISGTSGSARIKEGVFSNDTLTTDRGWMIARAVVRVTRGQVPVQVINLTDEEIVFRAGTYLGELEPLGERSEIVKTVRKLGMQEPRRDWGDYENLKKLADDTTRIRKPLV